MAPVDLQPPIVSEIAAVPIMTCLSPSPPIDEDSEKQIGNVHRQRMKADKRIRPDTLSAYPLLIRCRP
jgi:hypothetical protein